MACMVQVRRPALLQSVARPSSPHKTAHGNDSSDVAEHTSRYNAILQVSYSLAREPCISPYGTFTMRQEEDDRHDLEYH